MYQVKVKTYEYEYKYYYFATKTEAKNCFNDWAGKCAWVKIIIEKNGLPCVLVKG